MCAIGTLAATSAYPVYHNKLAHIPLPVSFFWFSCFAALASFVVPGTIFGGRGKPLIERIALGEWRRSISLGSGYVVGAGLAYSLYFLFLLKSLQYEQPGVVVTVLVLQQLGPVIFSIAGFYWLGHRCARWGAYGVGSVLVGLGVVLYKNALSDLLGGRLFDPVFWLVVLLTVCDAGMTVLRAKHKQRHDIDALHTVRSINLIAVLFGLAWMAAERSFALPNVVEFGALAFIGFVPSALASILVNRSIDVIGVPMMSSIRSLRPFFILAFGFVPSAWFSVEATHLGVTHYTGMALAAFGLLVIMWVAKPEEVV